MPSIGGSNLLPIRLFALYRERASGSNCCQQVFGGSLFEEVDKSSHVYVTGPARTLSHGGFGGLGISTSSCKRFRLQLRDWGIGV